MGGTSHWVQTETTNLSTAQARNGFSEEFAHAHCWVLGDRETENQDHSDF